MYTVCRKRADLLFCRPCEASNCLNNMSIIYPINYFHTRHDTTRQLPTRKSCDVWVFTKR